MSDSFEIKSAQLPVIALLLKTDDVATLCEALLQSYGSSGENPDFFDDDAVVVDCSKLTSNWLTKDLLALQQALLACHLKPIGIRAATQPLVQQARSLGWFPVAQDVIRAKPSAETRQVVARPTEVIKEVVREVVREVAGPATLLVDKPVRSGQKIYARGADLVLLAMVNAGGEVVADGNIHVYAPLRGKAMAGASGNTTARIFSTCLEPELISIAGVYRTSENALPKDIQGQAAQVRLSTDGQEKLLFEALSC
ncbi:MAG: septum site-determining protein MinC [Rhodoferax sp.]|nr:septum site-determining protein MinC [Rhodoferax sp.]